MEWKWNENTLEAMTSAEFFKHYFEGTLVEFNENRTQEQLGKYFPNNNYVVESITRSTTLRAFRVKNFDIMPYSFSVRQMSNVLEELIVPNSNTAFFDLHPDNTNLRIIDCMRLSYSSNYSAAFGASVNWPNLETLIIRTTNASIDAPNVNTFTFGESWDNGTCYLYVPSSMVSKYLAHSYWSRYAAQIRAIEDYPEITRGAL